MYFHDYIYSVPKRVVYLILIATALRMIAASFLELGNDEVYYYLYALDLQPNYFDHPPGVGIIIRIFTLNLTLTDELFVRLGAIVCAAIGTGLSYELGKQIKNEQTGWYAAILYTTSIYASIIAGTFIIPDSPQIVFWLATLLVMHKILLAVEQPPSIRMWLSFGLLSGLCILCKVHGIFLWLSLGLYILLHKRALLKDPWLYISALLTFIVISPILVWNIQNDFITYRFHSERVAVHDSVFHLDYFLQAIGGQLLYSNPLNAALMILSLWKLKSMDFLDRGSVRFIVLNSIPIILVVSVMALFNPMFPHWSGPGFLALSFLAAAYLDEIGTKVRVYGLPLILKLSLALVMVSLAGAALFVEFFPGTIGSKQAQKFGEDDFTLDLFGWRQFSTEFTTWLREQERTKMVSTNLPFVSNKWFPAAHIDFYVATPLNKPLIGVGRIVDLHQYYWLNKLRPELQMGDSALCVVPSNYYMILPESYLRNFDSVDELHIFHSRRSGAEARYFTVYLLKGYKVNDEAHAEGARAGR